MMFPSYHNFRLYRKAKTTAGARGSGGVWRVILLCHKQEKPLSFPLAPVNAAPPVFRLPQSSVSLMHSDSKLWRQPAKFSGQIDGCLFTTATGLFPALGFRLFPEYSIQGSGAAADHDITRLFSTQPPIYDDSIPSMADPRQQTYTHPGVLLISPMISKDSPSGMVCPAG